MERLKLDLNEVSDYYKKSKSLEKTAIKFNASSAGIAYWMRKRGIKINKQGGSKNKFHVKESYFEVINNQSAYWLGFLFADGNVYRGKQGYKLTLRLSKKDYSHLKLFKKHIGSNNNIKFEVRNLKSKKYECVSLVISSKKLVLDLIKLGCIPNKSLILKRPNLKPKFIKHFIRGYFDGDGCLYRYGKNKHNKVWFVLGTLNVLNYIKNNLCKECKISGNKIYKSGKIYRLAFNKQEFVDKIQNYLYDKTKLFLKRKKF